MSVDITRTVRSPVPRLPYEKMARAVLGARYELSLVICGDRLATRMNREHRGASYRPNVLSFPLSAHEGEIFLNVRCAAREARRAGIPLANRLALLYVHALWHLKGLDHSKKMDAREAATLERFGY